MDFSVVFPFFSRRESWCPIQQLIVGGLLRVGQTLPDNQFFLGVRACGVANVFDGLFVPGGQDQEIQSYPLYFGVCRRGEAAPAGNDIIFLSVRRWWHPHPPTGGDVGFRDRPHKVGLEVYPRCPCVRFGVRSTGAVYLVHIRAPAPTAYTPIAWHSFLNEGVVKMNLPPVSLSYSFMCGGWGHKHRKQAGLSRSFFPGAQPGLGDSAPLNVGEGCPSFAICALLVAVLGNSFFPGRGKERERERKCERVCASGQSGVQVSPPPLPGGVSDPKTQ